MFTRRSWAVCLILSAGLTCVILTGIFPSAGRGQPPLHMPRRLDDKGPAELLDAPRAQKSDAKDRKDPEQPILPPSYPGGLYPAIPVTLPEVLKLAILANLDVAQANLVVERARVALLRARAQFLPDLTAGVQHQAHDGTIQRTEGTIIEANRDSLFVGGGPALNLDSSAALFGPGQARLLLEATQHGQARVTLETLARVVDAYFNVLRARRQLARLDEVLDVLTSEQESELRGGSQGLLPLIKAFVKAGTALPSDQARVEADVVRRHGERVRALEDVRTASAELARLLHLNAAYFLLPAEDYRFPLKVPGEEWFQTPVEGLVEQALRSRPELAEGQARVEAALLRYRQAKWQPLLPRLEAGLSWGGFGGGPELKRNRRGQTFLGHSGNIKDFDVRTDLNLAVVWRLENLGLGNVARVRDARLQTEQAENRLLFQQDLVVAQVVQAMEGVQRGQARYYAYRAGLFDDAGAPAGTVYRSLRLNFQRIKGGQGLPLEVLDSTRRHSDVLQGYADAISDYDRSRYRLLVALGLSPEAIFDPSCMPPPPAAPAAVPPPGPPAPVVPVRAEVVGRAKAPDNLPGMGAANPPTADGLSRLNGTPLPPIGHAAGPAQAAPSRLPASSSVRPGQVGSAGIRSQ